MVESPFPLPLKDILSWSKIFEGHELSRQSQHHTEKVTNNVYQDA